MFYEMFDNCKIEMTDLVLKAIEQYGYFKDFVTICLSRHRDEDWGEIDRDLWRANDEAVKNGGTVIGTYLIPMDAENSLDDALIITTELYLSLITVQLAKEA